MIHSEHVITRGGVRLTGREVDTSKGRACKGCCFDYSALVCSRPDEIPLGCSRSRTRYLVALVALAKEG